MVYLQKVQSGLEIRSETGKLQKFINALLKEMYTVDELAKLCVQNPTPEKRKLDENLLHHIIGKYIH